VPPTRPRANHTLSRTWEKGKPRADLCFVFIAGRLGKSSLAVRFVDGVFVESYYPTIENTFSKEIKYRGQEYATEIVDTAGQVCAALRRPP